MATGPRTGIHTIRHLHIPTGERHSAESAGQTADPLNLAQVILGRKFGHYSSCCALPGNRQRSRAGPRLFRVTQEESVSITTTAGSGRRFAGLALGLGLVALPVLSACG